MIVKARLIGLALFGLLAIANSGHAVTLDSLQRSLSIMGTTNLQSNETGTFSDGLSWPGPPTPYNPQLGLNSHGAQVYQNTTVVNELDSMAVNGYGGLNVWWPPADQVFSLLSHLVLEFTPLTAASYYYSTGNDGGFTFFKDMVTGDYIYDGTGFLIAGHKYHVEAGSRISDRYVVMTGEYWSMELTVQEQPASVPLPGGFLLLAPGLLGMMQVRRKYKKH